MRTEALEEYVEYVTGRLAPLRQLAFLLCGDEHRADDVVQQTIEKLYLRWPRVSAVEHLDQYVRQMLVRTFLDERRRPWARVGLTDLLMPLRRAARGPSTVDVRLAVARGERRRAVVRAASVAAVVLVVVVGGWAFAGGRDHRPDPQPAISTSPGPEPSPTGCRAAELDAPPEAVLGSTVTSGDPTGRYHVGRSFDGVKATVLIWDRGRYQVVDLPGEGQTLVDVNSAGMAVGWTRRQKHVNDRRQIVGVIQSRPVVWATPESQPTRLALPGADYSGDARGIDEDGTVVGTLFHNETAAIWVWSPDGKPTKLPAPMIDGRAVTTYSALGIRNGWVIGRVGTKLDAALWNLRTGEVRVLAWGYPLAVNAQGWTAQFNASHAAIDTGGPRIDLPTLPGGQEGGHSLSPEAISDDGRTVAGTAITSQNGHRVAMLWTCR
ncbi:sigma factor [Dactylosporangium sp. NPDC000555]|uniref:sigma factor n=1 Tax=Dactylosporangium sp. NPDC000555 TaxID=3154260 RepID=UPI003321CB0A